MKKLIVLSLTLLGFACSTFASSQAQLDQRITKLTDKFEAMQQKADKAVPADLLLRAKGVILLDRTKAGFIFAYQGGAGVAMVKDEKTKKWSPPAFFNANEASLGFQVGGQQSFVVILLMDTNAVKNLTDDNFEFGGEARGTAGNESTGAGQSQTSEEQSVIVYSDRSGLYGGAALKGGAISPSTEDNMRYYGKYLTVDEILFQHKAQMTPRAETLAKKLTEYSKPKETAQK